MKKVIFIGLILLFSFTLAACSNTSNNEVEEKSTETINNQSTQDDKEQEKASFYYTAENGGITKIDATTNQSVKSIEIEGSVHNVQTSPDGKLLGATVVPETGEHGGHDSGHEEKTDGLALFYDVETDELISQVEVGSHPAHIVFTENMKYALVTNNEDNNVSLIDLETYQVIQNISTGNGPHGFRVATDSQTAYIANMGEDTVSVIDIESMTETKKIVVGNTPVTTGITPDGKTLVTTLNAEDSLVVINLKTEKVEKVQVGEGPAQVYVQSDGKYAFVANQGTPENPSNSVSKIELETRKVVATIEVGEGAHGIVTSEDNQLVYVTNMYENTVSVINNDDNQVIATLEVGEEPNGISIR